MDDIQMKMAAKIGKGFVAPKRDGQLRLVDVAVDERQQEKMKQAVINDEGHDDFLAQVKKQRAQDSYFKRIYKINEGEKRLLVLAFGGCMVAGVIQPVFGILFSEMIFYTTENRAIFGVDYEQSVPGEENLLCGYVAIIAVALFLAIGLRFYAFGRLAQNVAFAMRVRLYRSILGKDLAFFEQEKHDVGYLVGVLQDDAELLNGASIEKLGPWVEGFCSIVAAIIIAAVFCPEQMIACVLCLPVLVVCSRTMWAYQKGLTRQATAFAGEAAQLSQEMIKNFRTVQSLGHEEEIIKKYEDYLAQNLTQTKRANLWTGLFFGIAEGLFIFTFAVLFLVGGYVIKSNPTKDNDWEYDASEIFIPIFATVFAGVQAGTSEFFGPDTAAAAEAAGRVFEILDYASPKNVDALAADEDPALRGADQVTGKIEFRDVWFRHPNNRAEFVLRGMSFVIEPNESVAFVGEFGSGKSTIASLLLRFYDPDFGEIFLDGENIQSYKLHDLRK